MDSIFYFYVWFWCIHWEQALRRGLGSCSVYRTYKYKLSKVVKHCQMWSNIVQRCLTLSNVVKHCFSVGILLSRRRLLCIELDFVRSKPWSRIEVVSLSSGYENMSQSYHEQWIMFCLPRSWTWSDACLWRCRLWVFDDNVTNSFFFQKDTIPG